MLEDPTGFSAAGEAVEEPRRAESEIAYRPMPDDIAFGDADHKPVWRVRFDLAEEPATRFGVDINGEIILGRNGEEPNLLDLSPYQAGSLGVSRQHLMLRPTATHLFAIDMGSTNGTMRNGRSIGFNSPSRLVNGDVIALGKLQLVVNVIERPTFQTALLGSQPSPNLADALSQIAKAVTSQLELDEVLNQVTETAMVLTAAGETSIWLVDEISGDLFLKAERGIEDEKIQQMRLPIDEESLAGKVIKSGEPLYTHRQPGEDQIKLKTHYLVDALLYVPIKLGGVTLGVLSAVHRQGAKQFNKRDERLLMAIADFAAIAIQNARLYQATDEALQRRVKELSALNEVSHAVSASLDLTKVYDVLVRQVNRHWPVEAVHLYLLDGARQTLKLHPKSQLDITPSKFEEAATAKVAQTGEAVVAVDAESSSSIASVPLRIQDKIVGVLALLNKEDGVFADEDVSRLVAFANPVATAIQNANLFAESERQRAAILATARTLSQPLIIIDESGNVLVSNESANEMLKTNMGAFFEGISGGLGRTKEIRVGEETYLSTAQHLPDVGTIAVMQDITYVKQLEKDRSEFMHALSHDLKSPLTSIMGWAQLLEKVVTLDERGSTYVGKLVASAERMLDLINQMLQTVARGDVVQIERVPCDLRAIAGTVLSDAEGSALHKSITLSLEKHGNPYYILADQTRLYHMVLNLVDNAIKYSPDNTKIVVKLEFSE